MFAGCVPSSPPPPVLTPAPPPRLDQNYSQYIPLSIYELQTWMGAPSIYVYDCSSAGQIVDSFNLFASQRQVRRNQEGEVAAGCRGTLWWADAGDGWCREKKGWLRSDSVHGRLPLVARRPI